MADSTATRSKAGQPGGATSRGAEQPDCLPLAEAASLAGVSVQALRQRIKRGSLTGARLILGGRAVVGVSRRELERVFAPSAPGLPVAPESNAGAGGRSNSEQPSIAVGAPSAELIVLRSDYRAMLAEVRERAQTAEAREARARRLLGPALVGLALVAVALGVAWTGWRGASVRVGQLAADVPGLRARAEDLADQVTEARLAVGERTVALERAEFAALQSEKLYGEALAAERSRRQRAEAVVALYAVRHLFSFRQPLR